MTRWERAVVETTCGRCGTRQAVGVPVQRLSLTPVAGPRQSKQQFTFWRCMACADEPPPTWANPDEVGK